MVTILQSSRTNTLFNAKVYKSLGTKNRRNYNEKQASTYFKKEKIKKTVQKSVEKRGIIKCKRLLPDNAKDGETSSGESFNLKKVKKDKAVRRNVIYPFPVCVTSSLVLLILYENVKN